MSSRSILDFGLATRECEAFDVEGRSVEPSRSSLASSGLNLALLVACALECEEALRFRGFLGCTVIDASSTVGESDGSGLLACGLARTTLRFLRGDRYIETVLATLVKKDILASEFFGAVCVRVSSAVAGWWAAFAGQRVCGVGGVRALQWFVRWYRLCLLVAEAQ